MVKIPGGHTEKWVVSAEHASWMLAGSWHGGPGSMEHPGHGQERRVCARGGSEVVDG